MLFGRDSYVLDMCLQFLLCGDSGLLGRVEMIEFLCVLATLFSIRRRVIITISTLMISNTGKILTMCEISLWICMFCITVESSAE